VSADDPYAVLGVAPTASAEEIRRAYLKLARAHHPDYFVDAAPPTRMAAEARMRAVNDAWAVLGDPERRRQLEADRPPEPFRPLHEDDEDEPDPRDQPDVPYRPAPPPTIGERARTMAPVLLFFAALAVGVFGAVVNLPALLALGFALFLLSCVGFLVVPLLALSRARQDEG
jgi:hypothetical protein